MTRVNPPDAIEAEAAVLGCILVDHECLPKVAEILPDSGWFSRPRYAKVYDAINGVAHENGGVVDLVLLHQRLEDNGELKLVGGLDRLVEMASEFPSALHVTHYAKLVREKHLLFRALQSADELYHGLMDRPDEFRARLSVALDKLYVIAKELNQFSSIGGQTAPETTVKTNGRGTPAHDKAGSRRA